jgi:hypothetical protein
MIICSRDRRSHTETHLSSDCFALRDGLLHHGTCDGAVLVGDGIAHTLHGDVRRVGRVRTQTDDDQRVLKGAGQRLDQKAKAVLLTATPMMGDAWKSQWFTIGQR